MTAKQRLPEKREKLDISERDFNDLMYSVETKTYLPFHKLFVSHMILNVNTPVTDPIPDADMESVGDEIKKRAKKFDRWKLQDAETWLNTPRRKLNELLEKEKQALLKAHAGIDAVQLGKKEKTISEMETHQKKLDDLIAAIKALEVKSGGTENVRGETREDINQLHLFPKK